MAMASTHELVLDEFALRQFNDRDPGYTGTKVSFDEAEFEAKINEAYDAGGKALVDGYAPFCKHIFVPNFAGVKASTLPITPENEHLLRSSYEARTEQELPVLSRYFPLAAVGEPPECKYLDIILYSREQIAKEAADMDRAAPDTTAPWGIISVKAQDVDYELPMQPITMMRNALGRDQGGSGVELVREKYDESVAFWSGNAPIKV
uniref:Flagellar associated protein n=2 Tax=Phaeomonas parva TaxID=124430 RepID=A0A7S1XN97_9STRA|mmetsp:Transcript_19577/g.59270  ORF Transcript_19577/g.59270 Transcript_19577/m.59270 type:complete len:206 (+) Transcript_19577:303-920(+)